VIFAFFPFVSTGFSGGAFASVFSSGPEPLHTDLSTELLHRASQLSGGSSLAALFSPRPKLTSESFRDFDFHSYAASALRKSGALANAVSTAPGFLSVFDPFPHCRCFRRYRIPRACRFVGEM